MLKEEMIEEAVLRGETKCQEDVAGHWSLEGEKI